MILNRLPRLLARLPQRFQWAAHNIIGHPLMELSKQLGWHQLSVRIHDGTDPTKGLAPEHPGTVPP